MQMQNEKIDNLFADLGRIPKSYSVTFVVKKCPESFTGVSKDFESFSDAINYFVESVMIDNLDYISLSYFPVNIINEEDKND